MGDSGLGSAVGATDGTTQQLRHLYLIRCLPWLLMLALLWKAQHTQRIAQPSQLVADLWDAQNGTKSPASAVMLNWCSCPGIVQAPTLRQDPAALQLYQQMAEEVRAADQAQGVDVLFIGDSIFESLRGTALGVPIDRCTGVPEVLHAQLGASYAVQVLAVACDQIGHVMGRLQQGHVFHRMHPRLIVSLIGTNDLGAGSCTSSAAGLLDVAASAAGRVADMLKYLRSAYPHAPILSMALLPRGPLSENGTCVVQPSGFTPAVQAFNAALLAYSRGDSYVHYVDCGPALLPDGQLHAELMPDGLHPSAAGMEQIFGRCLAPLVDELLQS